MNHSLALFFQANLEQNHREFMLWLLAHLVGRLPDSADNTADDHNHSHATNDTYSNPDAHSNTNNTSVARCNQPCL